MAITLKRPDTLPAKLTLTGQGTSVTFDITYHNRTQSEFEAKHGENTEDPRKAVVNAVLYIVKEWELDIPLTVDGLTQMEDEWPGMILGVIQGFHQARQVTKEKN